MRSKSQFVCEEVTASPGEAQRSNPACAIHALSGIGVHGDISSLSEEAAYQLFLMVRWPATAGKPCCPECGNRALYVLRRRRFRCSDAICRREFSATTGTMFNSRKISFKTIMIAIHERTSTKDRMIADRLGKKLAVSYKTAHSLRARLGILASEGTVIVQNGRANSK